MAFTSTPAATHTHKIHKGSFTPLLFELYFLVPRGVHCMHRACFVRLFIIMHSFEIICSVRGGCVSCILVSSVTVAVGVTVQVIC